MKPEDETEFVKVIAAMSAQKPGKQLTPEGIELFWLTMQDWPMAEFKQAAMHLMRSVEFMPNPYHFEQLRKAGRETAGEAFDRARRIMKSLPTFERAGYLTGDARFDAAVNACGGYDALAMCETDKLHFLERRFAEHYEAICDAEDVRESVPMITSARRLGGPQRALSSGFADSFAAVAKP